MFFLVVISRLFSVLGLLGRNGGGGRTTAKTRKIKLVTVQGEGSADTFFCLMFSTTLKDISRPLFSRLVAWPVGSRVIVNAWKMSKHCYSLHEA